ncbi:hypothetical protein GH714_003028 [Hevea brasiliensis]|uniref:Uncharacterized protein n=1 Tax=Hevea brasiliensis TaxID=3981 RepID=A0A6A6KI91_HEVBR|nr:hypothetical protein GH714_003028 [Hevea brasiliensis]
MATGHEILLKLHDLIRSGKAQVYLDKLTNGKKDKLIIFILPRKYFRPIGEHERKLASWLGYCARSCSPPKKPWNAIEARYRTLLWSMIQDYFDVSHESPKKWKKLEEMQKALCSTNANNRASQKIIALTGPTPFAQVEYDMMDEEIGEVPYASEV